MVGISALGQNRHLSGVSVTDGLPSAADAPSQRSELAKSAMSGRQGDCRDDGHYALSEQDAKLGTGKLVSGVSVERARYDSAQRLPPPYAMDLDAQLG